MRSEIYDKSHEKFRNLAVKEAWKIIAKVIDGRLFMFDIFLIILYVAAIVNEHSSYLC